VVDGACLAGFKRECKPWNPIGIANECTLTPSLVSLMMAEQG